MSRDHRARIMRDSVKLLEWENKIAALTLKAYRRWLPSVRDAVLPTFDDQGGLIAAAFTEPVLPPNVEAITLTQAQWDAIMDETFVPGIEDLMARRVMDRLREEGWDIPPGTQLEVVQGITPFSPLTPLTAQAYAIPTVRDWQEAYLSEVRNRMVRTPDAVFREIAADLNEGMSKGEGIRELRARVQQQLVVSGTEIWKRRAETVARTEATGAFNGATHSAAHVAQTVLGIELDKVWVATIDGRTRKTHFAADGQRRGLDGEFKIGRSRLRWPGDPRGAAEEVINCRCTTIELEPDEETPGEYDRQTERGEGDATVRNREGSQQDEIDRRADDGVIRAREDPDGDGSVDGIQAAAGEQEQTMARRTWTGKLAPIGIPTGDGRQIKEGGKITFRPLPLTLSWQKVSAEGHMQSVVVGGITEAAVSADGKSIDGAGFMLETPEALEAVDLLEEKLIGVSIDPTAVVWEMVDANGNAISWEDLEEAYMNGEELEVLDQFAEMEVMGATLVDHPAFKEAQLTLDPVGSEDAPPVEEVEAAARSLVASVSADQTQARTVFEPESFEDPGFEELTPLHITADGRVQGHLAAWNSCHVAVRDKCKQPPRSMTNYAHFHVSSVPTAAGPLAVGHLTVGGGHADPRLGMIPALEHYDDVGSSWAIVRAHEDAFGIAVSGVVDPHATRQQVEKGLQVPLSGDWRGSGGNLELCAALSIITPGFVVPRGYRDEDGTEQSLVAAGAMAPADPEKRTSGRKLEDVMKRAAEAAVLAVYERQARENKARETAAALRAEKSDQTRARARELLNTEA